MGFSQRSSFFIWTLISYLSIGNCFQLQRSPSRTWRGFGHNDKEELHGFDTQRFLQKLEEMQRPNSAWGLNMEPKEQEASWVDQGFLNLHDGSLQLDSSELQGSGLNKVRGLSITNNLEVLRDRLLREIERKRSQDQTAMIHNNGRQRKSFGEQLNFLG